METLRAADAVIVNGEGTLHGTKPVVRNLLYLAYAAKVHLGRPVQIINHSCFPENSARITHPPTSALYRRVYEAMDFVAVREPISGQILQALGVPAVQSFDSLPLYVARHYRAQEERKRGGVVLAGGVSWRRETMPILARFIERVRDAGLTVSVLIGAKALPAPDDGAFVAALREAAPRGWALIEAGSARAWLDVIARARLLVSGRFHHSIAALSLRTPFIALSSNTPKMEGMLAMTGQPEPLAAAGPDLLDRLIERFEVALADGLPVLDEAALTRIRALAQHNFAGLDALAAATEAAR
jgi:polysaccharide pyruvyl transferase WcaK-like protein